MKQSYEIRHGHPRRVKARRFSAREARRQEAIKRAEEYGKLSAEEKIRRLDARLGVGIGAVKEREKLHRQLVEVV